MGHQHVQVYFMLTNIVKNVLNYVHMVHMLMMIPSIAKINAPIHIMQIMQPEDARLNVQQTILH